MIAKELIGHVDNSSYPLIQREYPHDAGDAGEREGPVPVLMMFGRAAFPRPRSRRREELERINEALKAMLLQQDPSLREFSKNIPLMNREGSAALSDSAVQRRRRPPTDLAAHRGRLGLCDHRPHQHSSRQRRRNHQGHHRAGQQRPAAQAGRLGRLARLGMGRGTRRSIISRPIPRWMPSTSASKASRVTARPRW